MRSGKGATYGTRAQHFFEGAGRTDGPAGVAHLFIVARLSVRVIDVHGRQVLHLLLGDVEPDTVVDPVTALIGIATSLRPHRCPSWRSTWVTW